jgi:GTPase SAR1 family protein
MVPSVLFRDTTGNEAYKELIKSCYKDAQVFLIFFSVIDPETFKNATDKVQLKLIQWYREVKEANNKALVFFVGNKIDQRNLASTGGVVTTK